MAQVKMITAMSGPGGTYPSGSIFVGTDKECAGLVKGGYATKVETADKTATKTQTTRKTK